MPKKDKTTADTKPVVLPVRPFLIAAERSTNGARLVAIEADGARQYALTDTSTSSPIVDQSPFVSPSGDWVVFASSRERASTKETSLWVVATEGGTPVRLTHGDHAVDRDPRLSRDGAWLYFISNRQGSFDLYRAAFDARTPSLGKIEQITKVPHQVLSPSLSPDDSEVVYMAVDKLGKSSIWRAAIDGSYPPRQLTNGPADLTPAWGPNGRVAFASVAPKRTDPDLYLMTSEGTQRELLVNVPFADETGARWSSDGRYVFAVGLYRSVEDHRPILGSIVFVDLKEEPKRLRVLHDPVAVESRVGLAVVPNQAIDSVALRKNREYREALRILFTEALNAPN